MVGRQPGIRPEDPSARRTCSLGVEVDDLADGVDARIGAPGADCGDGSARDESQRLLHRILQAPSRAPGIASRQYSVPSYSTSAATRRIRGGGTTGTGGSRRGHKPRQRFDQARGFLFLAGGAFLHDLLENASRTFRITHVHVGAGQIELGADLAHGHWLEFGRRSGSGTSTASVLLVLMPGTCHVAGGPPTRSSPRPRRDRRDDCAGWPRIPR